MRLGCLHHGPAIGVAQAPVGDDSIVGVCLELLDGILRRGGRGDRVSRRLQDCPLQVDDADLIVHAQDLRHKVSTARAASGPELQPFSQPHLQAIVSYYLHLCQCWKAWALEYFALIRIKTRKIPPQKTRGKPERPRISGAARLNQNSISLPAQVPTIRGRFLLFSSPVA